MRLKVRNEVNLKRLARFGFNIVASAEVGTEDLKDPVVSKNYGNLWYRGIDSSCCLIRIFDGDPKDSEYRILKFDGLYVSFDEDDVNKCADMVYRLTKAGILERVADRDN